MHFPFVREYQSDPHTERHTVTHFRHHYLAECSKFVADTIFHALTRETSRVEINKTCVCGLEMLGVTAEGSARRGWRRAAFLLLAQIITCFLVSSIKSWWPSRSGSSGDNVTAAIWCEMFTRIALVTHVNLPLSLHSLNARAGPVLQTTGGHVDSVFWSRLWLMLMWKSKR